MSSYQDPITAIKYIDFLNSKNGQIQQKILGDVISSRLSNNQKLTILDAACGTGWLSASLKKDFDHVEACDASEFFVQFARANYSGVDFKIASLNKPLPYPQNYFDAVVLNMAAPDLENLDAAFKNLSAVIKPGGKLFATVPNPKLTFPAVEWKKSWLDVLLFRKPKLKFTNFVSEKTQIQREFGKNVKIASYYYSLADYTAAAQKAGLNLKITMEITSAEDSKNFDLNYQLYRYSLILLLEFIKT